jgi:hypothetical protein
MLKASVMLEEVKDTKVIYRDIMREIIQEGGDTDTNACIIGGMVGAFLGYKTLPKEMTHKVLSFNCQERGIPRPGLFNTKINLVPNLKKLI